MTYSPTMHVKQLDGSRCASANCVAAAHSMAVLYATNGAKLLTPTRIRDAYADFCPGIPFTEARDAVRSLGGPLMTVRWPVTWEVFTDVLAANHACDVSIVYSVLHGTAFDACRTFDGHHSVCVYPKKRPAAGGGFEFLVGDPLADGRPRVGGFQPKGPQWWPASLLKKATGASVGFGNVGCSIAPAPPILAVTRKAKCGGGFYRTGPTTTYTAKARIATGDVCTISATREGGPWSLVCGTAKSGTAWYRITAINGKSTATLYGVAAVFASKGWF
jgi:hypothetical protein